MFSQTEGLERYAHQPQGPLLYIEVSKDPDPLGLARCNRSWAYMHQLGISCADVGTVLSGAAGSIPTRLGK